MVTSRDVTHLIGQVAGHGIDAIRQILPGACHALHVRLAAQNTFRADLARHARHFRSKSVQLIHHGIDGVLQLQNFALHIDRDFARQVAIGHGRRHFGDVTDLRRQVAGHGVHAIRQILPDAAHALHLRLTAQFAFGTDLARHAGHFRCEGVELIDHGVDGVLQLQNFAARIHGDLGGQVALGHGGRDAGDVANLVGQVRRHGVDRIRQILPRAGHALQFRLATQTPFGSDFARHASHFGREGVQLVDHRIHYLRGMPELTFERPVLNLQRHGLR